MNNRFFAILAGFAALVGCAGCGSAATGAAGGPDERVFCFYYNWYGNTEVNGEEVHWAHGVIGKTGYDGPAAPIPGGDNLAANFYPELRNYSSTDPATIARHVEMMARARIGVAVVTWWGDDDFGSPALLYNLDMVADPARPQVLACAAGVETERVRRGGYSCMVKGPLRTTAVMRILLPRKPATVELVGADGTPLAGFDCEWDELSHTCLLRFENASEGVDVRIGF